MKPMNKAVLPAVGLGVAAAATLGAVMMRPRKKIFTFTTAPVPIWLSTAVRKRLKGQPAGW